MIGNYGGGIYNGGTGTVTVTKCTISGNAANGAGGGLENGSSGTVTITNSTISGNSSSTGLAGGVGNHGSGVVNIINSTISSNSARGGAGVYNEGGAVNITNSTISGNTVSGGGTGNGGGITATLGGTVTITNSTISGNTAVQSGGGIYNNGSTVNARNTIVAQNTGTSGPDFFGTLTSQGYNLIGNTSGITITGTNTGNQLNVNPMLGPLQDNGGPTFTHALLSGSTAIEGGHSSGSGTDQRGLARPVDSPAIPNASGGDGSDIGAYEVQADVLPGCNNINRIVNNNADSGTDSLRAVIANVCAGSTITFAPNVTGAINLTSSELLIDKSLTITGPGAHLLSIQRGAGAPSFRIFNITPASAIVSISGLTIANGVSSGSGGGIQTFATLTLANTTIAGNVALNGGGIYNNFGTLTVTSSTISGNTLNTAIAGSGGGIFNFGGTLHVVNSTISDNTAHSTSNGDSGGGIITNVGSVTLTNSTIAGNTGDIGGGIRNVNGGVVRSRNTIIALNTSASGPDVNGPLTSENFNLIGNNSGATITPAQFSDQIGTAGSPLDPMLGPLQNNGGPTFTHALLAGSTAIDKGHSSGSTIDQRDFLRPVGAPTVSGGDGSDIGAFEVQAPAATPTPTPTPTPPTLGISGTVSYCTNPSLNPVPDVTMTRTGTSGGSTLTNGSGNYALTGLASGGSYTVTPTRTALTPGTNGIDGVDVLAVTRHFLIVGTPLTGCPLAAADVNGDTSVNGVDALAMQRFFLGNTSGISNTGQYQFSPANRSYSPLVSNQTGQNYNAMIFGDVASTFIHRPESGSSQDAAGDTNEVASTVAAITLPDLAVDRCRTNFSAAITTSVIDEKNKLVGFQGDFIFDERVIAFESEPVRKAGLTAGNWNVAGNVLPGTGPIRTLRVLGYSLGFTPLSGTGTLFELRMSRVDPATKGTQLIWIAPSHDFIFIDTDLNTQKPGNTVPGSVSPGPSQR